MSDVIIRGEDKTVIAFASIGTMRDISTATLVEAVLKSRSQRDAGSNGDVIICVNSGDADWRSGKVAIPYTAAQTEAMSTGSGYELELSVTIDGKIRKGFSKQTVDIYDSAL